MEFESDLSCTQEYKSFRSTVPLKQIVIDSDGVQVSARRTIHVIAQGTWDIFKK